MEELNIEKFDPTVADLQKLVAVTSQVVVTDIDDKGQLEAVKKNRISLRDARVAITKRGKELREDALKFQKAVIAKEKELIAIIEPEEDRLKAIEEEVKQRKLRAERIALLPERKKRLAEIGDGKDYSDKDELLIGMDASEFQAYLNARVADKNEAERAENERKARELREKEEAIEREKQAREREEKARQEERERIEREQREKAEREEREKKAEEERKAREEEARLRREEQERKEREENERYQGWLRQNGYTEEGAHLFLIKEEGEEVVLYQRVSTYKK